MKSNKNRRDLGITVYGRVSQVPRSKLLQRSIAPTEDMEASSSISSFSSLDLRFFLMVATSLLIFSIFSLFGRSLCK